MGLGSSSACLGLLLASLTGAPDAGAPDAGALEEIVAPEPTYCDDLPRPGPPVSLGRAAWGKLQGGVRLDDSPAARVMSRRHVRRCLDWGTPRLVAALHSAGAKVQEAFPGTPALGLGDLSRAGGGPIWYSFSHQSGRDADIAFFMDDTTGGVVPSEDLWHVGADGLSTDAPTSLRFDVARNWALVQALVEDPTLQIEWLFICKGLRQALLDHAKRTHVEPAVRQKAAALLHQPEGAPPHDDHLHLRIHCAPDELKQGCRE